MMFVVGNSRQSAIPGEHESRNLVSGSDETRSAPRHPPLKVKHQIEHRIS